MALAPFFYLTGRFFAISLSRMGVFYELEFQEGDMALACHRYLKGLPLYPDPEQGFVHLTYPPVPDVITSFAMLILRSKKIWVGRFVSFLFTMGILVTLCKWVWRETRSLAGAVFAPLVYLAYYPMTGYWYDIFRPDSGFIFFTLLGCYLLTWRYSGKEGLMAGVAGAIVFSIAAYTKQSAVLFGFIAFGIHVILYRNKTPFITALVGFVVSLFILVYLYLTNPFFYVQCIQILLEHGKNLESWRERLNIELLQFTLIPFVLLLAWYVISVSEKKPRALIHLALLATATYAGLKGLFKMGGYKNNYVPIVAFLSLGIGWFWGFIIQKREKKGKLRYESFICIIIIFVIGLWRLLKIHSVPFLIPIILFSILSISMVLRIIINLENRIVRILFLSLLGMFLFLWGSLLCHQFGELSIVRDKGKWTFNVRNPISLKVPHPQIVKDSWKVMERIRSLPGSVYIIHHNYYAWLIGKPIFYPVDTIRDLTIGRGPKMVPRHLLKVLNERQFDFIIINDRIERDWLDDPIRNAIRNNYVEYENLDRMGWRLLRPVDATGMKPRFIWRRKDWNQ